MQKFSSGSDAIAVERFALQLDALLCSTLQILLQFFCSSKTTTTLLIQFCSWGNSYRGDYLGIVCRYPRDRSTVYSNKEGLLGLNQLK